MRYTKSLTHFRSLRFFYFALVLSILVIAVVATNSSVPTHAAFQTPAQQRPAPPMRGLPNYDIRLSEKGEFEDFDLTSIPGRERAKQNDHARARLTAVDEFVKSSTPDPAQNLRAIANQTGAMKNFFIDGGTLSEPQSDTPDNIARKFLSQHTDLFALKAAESSTLKLVNEDNDEGTVFLEYAQTVGGFKVFEGLVQVVVSKNGEVLSVREGFLVSDQQFRRRPTLSEARGIATAFEHAGKTVAAPFVETHKRASTTEMSRFANPLDVRFAEVLSELNVVRVGNASRVAWHVYAEVGPGEWYEILVDADTGELLLRHNLYVHAAQGTVYTKSPSNGAARQLVSFVGDTTINPFGWLGSSTLTKGYNGEACIDRFDDNQCDNINGDGLSGGYAHAPDQNFTFPFSPTLDPRLPTQQAAVLTNLFYFVNFMHDFSYKLGFTETGRNFQLDNYGRGGLPNDPVLARAQDVVANNNAFFVCVPDGSSPRMVMGVFSGIRDSSVDSDIAFHEYGHGISNRLIGNCSNALSGIQSGAMGEGWSDYWAATINGDGKIGEYVTNSTVGGRRAAYAVPANDVHNSYADFDDEDAISKMHNNGEIWAATLWDLRAQLGAATVNRLVLQGMKFTSSPGPSFLNARDGILQADQNLTGGGNRCIIWNVFARHGMGVSAMGNDGTTHVAATDVPSTCPIPPVSMFPNDVPQTTASGNGVTWEQGVEFSSSVNGRITHVKFWKAPGETSGNHVGRIWSATGTQLASAPFLSETSSGWQTAALTPSLPITAGVRYRVTYNVHLVVAKTFNVFAGGPLNRPPFTIYGSSFCTPAGCFPTTGSTSNLFADIIFTSP